jgi:sugar lactone lactonase YvrE
LTDVYNTPDVATITSISPSQGPIAGGMQVTLTGSGFNGMMLTLDGTTITPQSASDTQIVFITPAHDNGIASIKLSGNGSNAYAEFLYLPPSLQSLPPGYITTVMGMGLFEGDGRAAVNATVTTGAASMATKADGTIYLGEPNNFVIRRIRSDGVIERYAGTGNSMPPYGDGGSALQAHVTHVDGLAISPAGNLVVADSDTNSIREIDATTGIIKTIAGELIPGFSGDGGPATKARFNDPIEVAYDGAGNLYVLDLGNVRIRKIDVNGTITTIAGTGVAGFSGDGGPATQATFHVSSPDSGGLAADAQGNVFLADDQNGRVRRIDAATGIITTFVSGVGPVNAVATDSARNVYVGDNNISLNESRILKVSSAGQLLQSWGKGTGFSNDGAIAVNAPLGNIQCINIDSAGNIIFAEYDSNRVRRINVSTGVLDTVGGMGPHIIGETGPALRTVLNNPGTDMAFLPNGDLLTAEGGNLLVRKMDRQGNLTDFAGDGFIFFLPTPAEAFALQTWLHPKGVAVAPSGNVFIVNDAGAAIVRVDAQGKLFAVTSNTGGFSGDGGSASQAALAGPSQAATDSAGNLFIADTGNHRIRRIDAQTNTITTVAGNGMQGYCGDGGLATNACLDTPIGVAADSDGSFYIGENNQRIRKVGPTGIITTLYVGAGSYLALNPARNLFTAGCRIEPGGHAYCAPFQGQLGPGLGDGGPVNQAKASPGTEISGSAVNDEGDLFFADGGNRRMRAIRFGAVIAEPGSTVSATEGTPQTAPVSATFPVALQVTLRSPVGTLENGVRVDFSAPSSGALCTFPNGNSTYSVLTDINGRASATCTANSQIGSYVVTATPLALGQSASFSLNNAAAPIPSASVQLSSTSYSVGEGAGFATITVTRTGDLSAASTVKYATSDSTSVNFQCNPATAGQSTGVASRKCDYHIAVGRLRFNADESTKQITLSIINDVYVEGTETFSLTLSNPVGAVLGSNSTATISITDNDTAGQANPIDQTRFYVRQLYVDLLSREPDTAGWDGWTSRIDLCGQPGQPPPPCDRVTVGGDGFLRSNEFFDRQFFVLKLYRTGLGRIPLYDEVGDLAFVSGFLSSTDLELNKQELVTDIMARSEFANKYNNLSNSQFVSTLLSTAGVIVSQAIQDGWVTALNASTKTKAQVFREVSERQEVSDKYLKEAQVISAYYGFFTRNPDGAYLIFLDRLTRGEINLGDLANAFINAAEYRQRFGP